MRVVALALAALLAPAPALDGDRFNTDMYAPPDGGAKAGTGKVVTYHKGQGEVAKGYFKKHAPGEVAEFHLFVPDGLKPDRRYPCVIVYHGGKDGGSGRGFAKQFGRLSTKEHPVFVLSPNMYTIDAFDEIVAAGKHLIDRQRILVMGFSSGGMGVGAAMRAFMADPAKYPFACFVCMSTFAAPPAGFEATGRPFVVVAGENETPEHAKHPALKRRRDGCRQAAVKALPKGAEVRYIEVQGEGHSATKPKHLAILKNLLWGIGGQRLTVDIPKARDEVQPLLAAARDERWTAVRSRLDALEADTRLGHVSKTARSKLRRLIEKWVAARVKVLRRLGPKSSHLARTRALHTHDHLRRAAKAFDGHPLGESLAKSLKKLDGAKQLGRELDARKRWNAAVRLADRDQMTATLEELRGELGGTEYGRNRTREVLLALSR